MRFSEQVDQICGEAGTETFTECAAISFLCFDKEFVNFSDGSFERRPVDPWLKFGGESIVELYGSSYKEK